MIKNLELFKVFYYVATTSSLTKAAEKLSITQPAVSQSMKQLESHLNVKLFKRTAKGIRLTGEGEMLFNYVSKGYESMEMGVSKLHEILDLKDGEVTIGANDYGIKYYLLTNLETFRSKFPNIRLNILPMEESEIIPALSNRKIDIGISLNAPSEAAANLTAEQIDNIQYVFAAGNNYTYLKAPMLPLQLLSHLPLISRETHYADRALMDYLLSDNHINTEPAYELSSPELLVQYAVNNFGVAFLPRAYTLPYTDNGSLIELSLATPIPTLPLYLVKREDNDTSKAALTLTDTLLSTKIKDC